MCTSLRTMSKSSRRSRSVLSASAPRVNVVTGVRGGGEGRAAGIIRRSERSGARDRRRGRKMPSRGRGAMPTIVRSLAVRREEGEWVASPARASRRVAREINLPRSSSAAASHLRNDTSGASSRRCEGREGRHRRREPSVRPGISVYPRIPPSSRSPRRPTCRGNPRRKRRSSQKSARVIRKSFPVSSRNTPRPRRRTREKDPRRCSRCRTHGLAGPCSRRSPWSVAVWRRVSVAGGFVFFLPNTHNGCPPLGLHPKLMNVDRSQVCYSKGNVEIIKMVVR